MIFDWIKKMRDFREPHLDTEHNMSVESVQITKNTLELVNKITDEEETDFVKIVDKQVEGEIEHSKLVCIGLVLAFKLSSSDFSDTVYLDKKHDEDLYDIVSEALSRTEFEKKYSQITEGYTKADAVFSGKRVKIIIEGGHSIKSYSGEDYIETRAQHIMNKNSITDKNEYLFIQIPENFEKDKTIKILLPKKSKVIFESSIDDIEKLTNKVNEEKKLVKESYCN